MVQSSVASEEESSGIRRHWSSESVHRLHFESVQAPPLITSLTRAVNPPPPEPPLLLLSLALKVKEKSEMELNENEERSDGGKVPFALVLLAF